MKRTPLPVRRTPLRRCSKKRAAQKRAYAKVKAEYLLQHPWCQLVIAREGLDEAAVIRDGGWVVQPTMSWFLPQATEIHHRNKGRGARLTDVRWFMSACREQHDYVEAHKDWARLEGYLLPENADADGRLPDGTHCMTTPVLMAVKALTAEGIL